MQVYPRVSTSVSKLGKEIGAVNLPPVVSCRKDAPCIKGCYATKGRFCFKKIRESLLRNYQSYIDDPERFHKIIDGQLIAGGFKYFRWHSSGDIIDENYLNMMCRLARRHRETKFLCFTKKYELVNGYLDKHRKPSNLILVFSNWDGWKCDNPHNLPMSYVRFKSDTDIPKNAKECSGNCGECVNTTGNCWSLKKGESVVFKKH